MEDLLRDSYNELVDIWRNFCRLHTDLFEYTCEEYSLLLSSEIDQLEVVLKKKEDTIVEIKENEKERKNIIDRLNLVLPEDKKIHRVYELLNLMNLYEVEKEESYLTKYNSLLIDIIGKIKLQNKRNQIFINKSLKSLKVIRDGLSGLKSFQTYNSQGLTGNSRSP